MKNVPLGPSTKTILKDLRGLILAARQEAARAVNSTLVTLYWRIGKRICEDILGGKRAKYGRQIVHALSAQLTAEFGSGFGKRNLFNMIRFAQAFPDEKIVSALRRELGWTHFKRIIYLDDPLKRDFYAEMCRLERWSTRTLEKKIGGMLFERTAISRKPAKLVQMELKQLRAKDKLTPDIVFHDPYILDFLGLKDGFQEKDLEAAILREMESFLLEMGIGFTFVERQKRISVDSEDYYLDLLLYHRKLKCLVAIELKLDKFKAAYKGQMELYLRWLEKNEVQIGEARPIGLILCAGKAKEHVELLQLGKSGIRVASYLTELPPRKILQAKLRDMVHLTRLRLKGSN